MKKSLAFFIIFLIGLGACLFWLAQPAISANDNFMLVWTSNSYVPPTYQGRALPTLGSNIKVVALPTKKLSANTDSLIYRWLLDDNLMGYANGAGKSAFQFGVSKDAGDSHQIECQILDSAESAILWRGFLTIKITKAEVLLKESNSDYSTGGQIITRTDRELKLLAAPLFFHIQSPDEVSFGWTFAGQKLTSSDQKNPDQFTLKIPAGELSSSLSKKLKAAINHKTDRRQSASVDLNIQIQ